MSKQWKPTQKIRAYNTAFALYEKLQQYIKDRTLETFDTVKVDDILLNSGNGFLYRVESITEKTVVLSECHRRQLNLDLFDFGFKPKRMRANTFNNIYQKVTMQEIFRSRQLSRRLKAIQAFKVQTGN